jgi:2-dehydro-3-deoxygalactonokinase
LKILSIGSNWFGLRLAIVEENRILGEASASFELTAFLSGSSKNDLIAGISDVAAEAILAAGINRDEIEFATAYGPIVQGGGLGELAPEPTPAGLDELVTGTCSDTIPVLGNLPLYLIPGVRNFIEDVGHDTIGEANWLAGDETYAIGLIELEKLKGPFSLVISGKRTRFIHIDKKGRISRSLTTFSGRLAEAIVEVVPISAVLPSPSDIEPDNTWIRRGARAYSRAGLPRAVFETELLARLTDDIEPAQLVCFLLGAMGQADLDSAWRMGCFEREEPIYIAGDQPYKEILGLLAADEYGRRRVRSIADENEKLAAPLGSVKIASYRNTK